MKYIFITFSGLSLPIAYKLQKQRKDVWVGQIENIKDYVTEEESQKIEEDELVRKRRLELYQNILDLQPAEKIIEKLKTINDPYNYFMFFEENNLFRWADKIRDLGFEGIFPTKEDFLFEMDRNFAKEFVKKNYPKLHTTDVKEFSKVEDAIDFLGTSDETWVLKGKEDRAKTFIPDVDDPNLARGQVLEMLKNFKERYEKMGFILEVYIPTIIELTPEKIYYDGVPLALTVNIENKAFGSGNISVMTGCSEDLVFPITMDDRINKIAFPPVVDQLARNHKGLFIWDASLLIDKKNGKIYFGEFCSNRPGYNSIFTELAQSASIESFFESVVHKNNPFTLGTVGASARIFNLNRDPQTQQISSDIIVDYKPEIEKDLWLWDVKRNERGKMVTVGSDWNLAVITGAGKSIDEAVSRLYKNIEGFAFVGGYYRSKHDFLTLDYSTSILNRFNYGLDRSFYQAPFNVRVGEIKM